MTHIHLLHEDLPDPLSNYANSAERHPSGLVSLCRMWRQRIFWSKFSCTILPFNHTHQFQSQLDLAVPISSTSSLCQMREGLLGILKKAAELEEDEASFPGWVLGVCPGHLGLRRMRRKQPRTVCENRNLCFSLQRTALLLAWAYHGQTGPCFPKWHLKHIVSPFFTCTGTVWGGMVLISQSISIAAAEYKTWSSGLPENAD